MKVLIQEVIMQLGTTTNSGSNNVASSTSGNSTNQTSGKGQLPNTGDLGGVAALFMGVTSLAIGYLGLKKRKQLVVKKFLQ